MGVMLTSYRIDEDVLSRVGSLRASVDVVREIAEYASARGLDEADGILADIMAILLRPLADGSVGGTGRGDRPPATDRSDEP